MTKTRFCGVLPPMLTPFTASGDVDYDAFEQNIHQWNKDALAGYLVNGSNSETAYLDEQEKLELVRLTVKAAAKDRVVVAGTGLESLRATIDCTNAAAAAGAHYALVLTPNYYDSAMTSEALIDYFSRLADKSDIPVLIYNVPKFTHVNIKADAVQALAQHPKIVGMKDSTGDMPQLANFLRVTAGQDFEILLGTASAWYPALCMGVKGGIHASANCVPNACAAVQQAYDGGDMARAFAIHQVIFPLNAAVTGTYGIPGLKYVAEAFGYQGGYVRCPLQPLKDAAKQALDGIIATARRQLQELGVNP